MTFIRNLLIERYVNVFSDSQKKPFVSDVWDILTTSYSKIGGIKGSGFESKDSMISKIPFWKLVRKDEKIIACMLYKDKNGRKLVALGSDGTPEGKEALKKMFQEELKSQRAYGEISGPALKFVLKHFENDLKSVLIPAERVSEILGKEVEITGEFTYVRNIGGHKEEKIMYGKEGQRIE